MSRDGSIPVSGEALIQLILALLIYMYIFMNVGSRFLETMDFSFLLLQTNLLKQDMAKI